MQKQPNKAAREDSNGTIGNIVRSGAMETGILTLMLTVTLTATLTVTVTAIVTLNPDPKP